MDNEQLSNDFEEQYKEQLENLPEERPSLKDWEVLRTNLQREGLIKNNSNGRKYFLLLLLAALVAGGISIPLLMNRYGIDLSFISSSGGSGEQSKIAANDAEEKAAIVDALQNETPRSEKNISEKNKSQPHSNDETTQENNSNTGVNLLARQVSKKAPVQMSEAGEDKTKNEFGTGENGNRRGEAKTHDSIDDTMPENATSASSGEIGSKQVTSTDSLDTISTTTQPQNNPDKKSDADSVAAAVPVKDAKADSAQASNAVKDTTGKKSAFSPKPWIGVFVSWDFTSYHLKENNNYAREASNVLHSTDIEGVNSLSQYTVGVMGGLRITPKLALEAGAFYSQKKKLSDTISLGANADASGNESFSDFVYCYNAKYIEAYGRIKYYFFEKKHSFYATAGAAGSFNFPSSKEDRGYFERITFSEESGRQTDIVTLESSSAGLSIVVSAGMEVIVSQRWNLFVEPGYKYALTSVTRHPNYDKIPVEHFWRTFSLGTGLMYKF